MEDFKYDANGFILNFMEDLVKAPLKRKLSKIYIDSPTVWVVENALTSL